MPRLDDKDKIGAQTNPTSKVDVGAQTTHSPMEDSLSELEQAYNEARNVEIEKNKPLWRGPEEEGITFSLLSRFIVCRERFRLLVIKGLTPHDTFNHRLEFGNLWHLAEETYANCLRDPTSSGAWKQAVDFALKQYAGLLCSRYPIDQDKVEHWYSIAKLQFPIYLEYWSKNKDTIERKPLISEEAFCVPYTLPSGRTVLLRGKWDSVDSIGLGNMKGIYLQENKTKGEISPLDIQTQLSFDLQTMMYLVALETWQQQDAIGIPVRFLQATSLPIKGVRYNVIRRPLSGGKHTIVRHKPSRTSTQGETFKHFYGRLEDLIRSDPEYFFMRWKIEVHQHDIERFKVQCFNPLLEQLCDWWEWASNNEPWGNEWMEDLGIEQSFTQSGKIEGIKLRTNPVHWRLPYGVYNPLLEGGSTDFDNYLATGSESGLTRAKTLFPELEGK